MAFEMGVDYEQKVGRGDGSGTSATACTAEYPPRKKRKPSPLTGVPSRSSGKSPESSPDSIEPLENSPSSSTRCQADSTVLPSNSLPYNNLLDFSPDMPPENSDLNQFPAFDCGLCTEDTPCVCREIVIQEFVKLKASDSVSFDLLEFPNTTSAPSTGPQTSTGPPTPLILDNMPEYQPPVPLRRRPAASSGKVVFPVTTPKQKPPANCSGNPADCMACADDSFGRAFCTAIGDACANCPCGSEGPLSTPDSGEKGFHGNSIATSAALHTVTEMCSDHEVETMPTNVAWAQLKRHPNVAFTDLSLLADVVARRPKCTGPRIVISPAPNSATSEIEGHQSTSQPSTTELESRAVSVRTGEDVFRREGSPPMLVPQEVLIRCGRERLSEVRADAVRDALRLLDAKFSASC